MQPLPLFTLGSVLFPGGRLPLQIFEQRYLDLVRHSLKHEAPFGMVFITEGSEVLQPGKPVPELAAVGCTARIIDWDALPSGLLGITVAGGERFRLGEVAIGDNKLVSAEVELLPQPAAEPLPESADSLLEVLLNLEQHPHVQRLGITPDHDNAWDVCWTLAQLLPMDEPMKYNILEADSLEETIERLDAALHELGGDLG